MLLGHCQTVYMISFSKSDYVNMCTIYESSQENCRFYLLNIASLVHLSFRNVLNHFFNSYSSRSEQFHASYTTLQPVQEEDQGNSKVHLYHYFFPDTQGFALGPSLS